MFLYIVSLFLFFCIPCSVYATTITLKNGLTVSGDIVKETDKMVNINVNNTPLTYYKDEIDSIDGKPVVVSKVDSKEDVEKRVLANKIVALLSTDEVITDKIMGRIVQLPMEKRDAFISAVKGKLDMESLNKLRVDGMVKGFNLDELNAGASLMASSAGKKFFLKSFTTYAIEKQQFNRVLSKAIEEVSNDFKLPKGK